MSRQVLGKRTRSSLSSTPPSPSPIPASKSRRTFTVPELPSPDPTPNPKRVKACSTETDEDDGSNKENIPPEPIHVALNASDDTHNSNSDASSSTATMTPRALRASRRASMMSTRSMPIHHHAPSSRSQSRSPSVSRNTDHRHGRSQTQTPSKSMSRLSLATPPSTPVSMPPSSSCVTKDASVTESASLHNLVRALLRPQTQASTPLVGREPERKQLLDFLKPFFAEESSLDDITGLYVSGAPGTGKTALINDILTSVASGDIDIMDVNEMPIRYFYVNCMTLGAKAGIADVYEFCLDQVRREKVKKRGAIAKISWSERFGDLFRGQKCILVLDEIDRLAASVTASDPIAQIFDLASDSKTRPYLRVIGISNTHTLTHAKPTAHTKTLHFQPYSSVQMKSILHKRLECLAASGFDPSQVFPASTIALLAFRIANETGDIRTVFSVARRALDLAATPANASSTIAVSPVHVLAALKTSNISTNKSSLRKDGAETVTKVRNLGLHSRFALVALLIATKRTVAGLSLTASSPTTSSGPSKENISSTAQGRDAAAPAIDVTSLHAFYATILGRGTQGAFRSVGRTEFGDLVGLLEGSGLVELTQGRVFGNNIKSPTKGKGKQVICVARGVREEELVRGLVGSTNCVVAEDATVRVSEEEVKNVWEREIRRLQREVKAGLGDVTRNKASFEDAEED